MTKWYRFWKAFDAARVFPRVFLVGYGALCWKASLWFMALDGPSAEQAAFVTLIAGFFVPLANFYMNNGVKWEPSTKSSATVTVTEEK